MLAGFRPPYSGIQHVPGWLHALSCFPEADGHWQQQRLPGACAAAAEKLAAELLHAAGECLRTLIMELHQVIAYSSGFHDLSAPAHHYDLHQGMPDRRYVGSCS
jgi:hypothetical protein